jgi:hypothetical protein
VSVAFVAVTLCFELAFSILAMENFWADARRWSVAASICWGFTFSIIIMLNLLAFLKISQVKWTSLGMLAPPSSSPHARESRSQSLLVVSGDAVGIKRLMTRIQITCVCLAVSSVAIGIMLSSVSLRSSRSILDDPRCYLDTVDLIYRSSVYVVLFSSGITLWFVWPTMLMTRKKHRSSLTHAESLRLTRGAAHIFNQASPTSPYTSPLSLNEMSTHHYLFKSRNSVNLDSPARDVREGASREKKEDGGGGAFIPEINVVGDKENKLEPVGSSGDERTASVTPRTIDEDGNGSDKTTPMQAHALALA